MRFAQPWALWALLPVVGLLVFSLRRGRPLAARALTLALLVLALAEPELALRRTQETVVFLVDRSASVGQEAARTLDILLPEAERRGAQVAVIGFAGSAQVERWPGWASVPGVGPSLDATSTDLAAAMDLALALAPQAGTQLVLISDGRVTQGDWQAAVARARAQGVPVHVYPVGPTDVARVAEFVGPREAPVGQLSFQIALEAGRSITAQLALWRNRERVQERPLELRSGRTQVQLVDAPPGPGNYTYRVELFVPGDPFPENNAGEWGVVVGDPPGVLVVGPRPTAVDDLLQQAGIPFRRVGQLGAADLGGVGLVILDDVPLGLLGERGVALLRAFVAGGGGLWVVQGRQAVSGYTGPLEELLPVTYTVPERIQEASTAVVFVLDRSASMGATSQGVAKIDLLKEATAAAVETLAPEDLVGALAFDTLLYWLVKPEPVREAAPQLFGALRELTASGGTDLYPAVREALAALAPIEARIRHIVVVSDGKTLRADYDFPALYAEVAASGVGVTAIGIGADADTEVLQGLAQAGQGRLFLLSGMADLRPILVQEVERVSRPRFVERTTPVRPGPAAAALGLPAVVLPPLEGFTLTFPKPTAEVALLTPAGDPVLAWWRLGLGQVAVLNADLSGVWTRQWLASPELGTLFGRMVGKLWGERREIQVQWAYEGGELRIVLDVEQAGAWVNGLRLQGELVGGGKNQTLVFDQVAPGRYEAQAEQGSTGVHILSVIDRTGRFGGTFLVSLPYVAEFEQLGPNLEVLSQVARWTGGRVLEDEVVPPLQGAAVEGWPLARSLLWAAAGAFLLDLLLRKLLA